MTTLLLDGDILVYKAAFGAEEVHSFDGETFTSSANMNKALADLESREATLVEELKADAVIYCVSHSDNWRKAIYPDYKAQRRKVRKPVLLKPLVEHVLANKRCYQRPTLEADDLLGILMTHPGIIKDPKRIIVSIDKDLLQIPGRHFNLDTQAKRVVTDADGDRLHFMQTLTGDVVDNYPGLRGCGPKKAEQILAFAKPGREWKAIVAAFEKKGLTEEDALTQARIARICRAADYDFAAKTVIPWTPRTE